MSPFTPGELEIMEVLWRCGQLKPAEIQEQLRRPLNNAALRSVLRVLLQKGHVSRRKVGKAYYYRAKRPAESAFRSMARRLADIFCNGSPVGLIAELIRAEKLSPEEIRQLQQLAESSEGTPKATPARRDVVGPQLPPPPSKEAQP